MIEKDICSDRCGRLREKSGFSVSPSKTGGKVNLDLVRTPGSSLDGDRSMLLIPRVQPIPGQLTQPIPPADTVKQLSAVSRPQLEEFSIIDGQIPAKYLEELKNALMPAVLEEVRAEITKMQEQMKAEWLQWQEQMKAERWLWGIGGGVLGALLTLVLQCRR